MQPSFPLLRGSFPLQEPVSHTPMYTHGHTTHMLAYTKLAHKFAEVFFFFFFKDSQKEMRFPSQGCCRTWGHNESDTT